MRERANRNAGPRRELDESGGTIGTVTTVDRFGGRELWDEYAFDPEAVHGSSEATANLGVDEKLEHGGVEHETMARARVHDSGERPLAVRINPAPRRGRRSPRIERCALARVPRGAAGSRAGRVRAVLDEPRLLDDALEPGGRHQEHDPATCSPSAPSSSNVFTTRAVSRSPRCASRVTPTLFFAVESSVTSKNLFLAFGLAAIVVAAVLAGMAYQAGRAEPEPTLEERARAAIERRREESLRNDLASGSPDGLGELREKAAN
ncbi:MAG: hypothetical protein ACK6CU_09845 [Deltaproteobacteria bacterium]